MGLKVHRDGFKPANSLEWWSAVAFVRLINANVNLVFELKERLETL